MRRLAPALTALALAGCASIEWRAPEPAPPMSRGEEVEAAQRARQQEAERMRYCQLVKDDEARYERDCERGGSR